MPGVCTVRITGFTPGETTMPIANGRNKKRMERCGAEDGSPLPLPPAQKKLGEMTEAELAEVIRRGHRGFLGCMRAAIKQQAREAGEALLVVKLRLKRRGASFREWLAELDCKLSIETARLYIRVAKNWDLVEKLGLDRDDVTLEDLRHVLSDSFDKAPEGSEEDASEDDEKDEEKDKEDADKPGGENTPGLTHKVELVYDEDDGPEFDADVRYLAEILGTENPSDTVLHVVSDRRRLEAQKGGSRDD
jgi:hypothetical protein